MLAGLKGAAEYEKLVDVFAAYRAPGDPMGVTYDEEGNKIVPGRSFSSDVLEDESIQKLLKITTQTKAVFSQPEFDRFLANYPPEVQALMSSYKTEEDNNVVIDVTKVKEDDQKKLGYTAWNDLNRMTHNTIYKFKTARIGMNAQSVAHIMIILFIIIGNIGYFISRAKAQKK
jgi:hypothetical protein